MSLRRFRRQYEQLSQFERGRIIGMMEAGCSGRRVSRELGLSDCVVRRYWDQWIREMSFTRRPGSGRPRQTSRHRKKCTRRANCFIGRHPVTGSFSLGAPVSFRTIRRRLAEEHLGSRCPLRVLPFTPTHRRLRLECCHARGNWTVQRNGTRSSLATNPISAVMTIVFVCRDPVVNASILPLLYSDTSLPQLV
ncbi:transposable element Tcb2 transposase [Trichonephila clavipes]|nr:transposable element Tcb2 transposase [Trichonephila clavipes]